MEQRGDIRSWRRRLGRRDCHPTAIHGRFTATSKDAHRSMTESGEDVEPLRDLAPQSQARHDGSGCRLGRGDFRHRHPGLSTVRRDWSHRPVGIGPCHRCPHPSASGVLPNPLANPVCANADDLFPGRLGGEAVTGPKPAGPRRRADARTFQEAHSLRTDPSQRGLRRCTHDAGDADRIGWRCDRLE
jgi:hypothetical protein